MITKMHRYSLDAALHGLYQKRKHTPPNIKVLNSNRACGLNPCVMPFVPAEARSVLNASVKPFVPQAVRDVLRATAPLFVPVSLNTHASLNVPQSAQDSYREVSSPIHVGVANYNAGAGSQAHSRIRPRIVPLVLSKLNIHAAISILSRSTNSHNFALCVAPKPTSLSVPSGTSAPDTATDRTEELIELSLVHHVDPIDLAHARSCSNRGPVLEELVHIKIEKESLLANEMIHTQVSANKLALCQVKILPALPLLLAVFQKYQQQIRYYIVSKSVQIEQESRMALLLVNDRYLIDLFRASLTPDPFVLRQFELMSIAKLWVDTLSQNTEALIDFLVVFFPHVVKKLRGRLALPGESGMGPSFKQVATNKFAELKDLEKENASEPKQVLSGPPHHLSYLGDEVPHASFTDPALSLAVILGGPKGAMSDVVVEDQMRMHVVLRQAFLLVDPVIVVGNNFMEFAHLSISQIRDAAVGRVYRYYLPNGTWSVTDYLGEYVYCDRGLTGYLPPVFTEVHDQGHAYNALLDNSFRDQIEVARNEEAAVELRRIKRSRNPAFIGSRSWLAPGPSPLRQVQLASSVTVRKITFGRFDPFLKPSEKSWAELDEESDDESEIYESNAETPAEGEVNEVRKISDSASFQSQTPTSQSEQFDSWSEYSASIYSSDEEETIADANLRLVYDFEDVTKSARLTQLQQSPPLVADQKVDKPFADCRISPAENAPETTFEIEDNTAATVGMSPKPFRSVRRSLSDPSPLPEAADVLVRVVSLGTMSVPSRLTDDNSSEWAYRPNGNLPRSPALQNLSDVSVLQLPGRPQRQLSPIVVASIVEDKEADAMWSVDVQDDSQEESSLLGFNQPDQETHGVPEPDLPSLYAGFGDDDDLEFTYQTPRPKTEYREKKLKLTALPTVLSSEDTSIESRSLLAGIAYTPPSPAHSAVAIGKVDMTMDDAVSNSSSICGGVNFDSSPPGTPTRATRPESVAPSQTYVDHSILDGISTSPLNLGTSPVRAATLGFSTLISIDTETVDEVFETIDDDEALLREEFGIFQPQSMLQVPETLAPSVSMTSAHGEMSIADLPEVRKTGKLSKLKAILSKSKNGRAVLENKKGDKNGAGKTSSNVAKVSSSNDATTKKKGFWGSVKSRMSTIKRQ